MMKAAATSATPRKSPLPIPHGGSMLPKQHGGFSLSRWEDEGGALDPYSQVRRGSKESDPASQLIRLIDRAEYFGSLGIPCE